ETVNSYGWEFVWLQIRMAANSVKQETANSYGCKFVWLRIRMAANSCACQFYGILLHSLFFDLESPKGMVFMLGEYCGRTSVGNGVCDEEGMFMRWIGVLKDD
ncbi:hypothetical protein Tco_1178965, partial [Tanacetum coccineum]